jgi:hypothetical protein
LVTGTWSLSVGLTTLPSGSGSLSILSLIGGKRPERPKTAVLLRKHGGKGVEELKAEGK